MSKKLVQYDLFNKPILNLCSFCGYPKPTYNYRCEFQIDEHYGLLEPFKPWTWHVDIDKEARDIAIWRPKVEQALRETLQRDPKLRSFQLDSWVQSKLVKRRITVTQVCLLSYLISSGSKQQRSLRPGA